MTTCPLPTGIASILFPELVVIPSARGTTESCNATRSESAAAGYIRRVSCRKFRFAWKRQNTARDLDERVEQRHVVIHHSAIGSRDCSVDFIAELVLEVWAPRKLE
jgi:hypothetical protein